MITLTVDFDNPISQEFYNKIINNLQFHRLTCSCGRSGCLTIHGYYNRNVKYADGTIHLRICRVKCSHCGRTHALLPSYVVPYSQVSLPDQVGIVCCKEDSSDFSSDFSEIMERTPEIDRNCIYYIIRRYVRYWQQLIRSAQLSITSSTSFIQLCFSHFKRQFMQIKKTPNVLYLRPT